MPVSSISVVGVRFSTSGAGRWIGQRSSPSTSSPSSIVSPSRLKIRPKVALPTGTVIGPPGVEHLHATGQPVGAVHRHRTHAVVTQVLLDLAHQHAGRDTGRGLLLFAGLLTLDADCVVDLGQLLGEHGLDDHALDLLDAPDVALAVVAAAVGALVLLLALGPVAVFVLALGVGQLVAQLVHLVLQLLDAVVSVLGQGFSVLGCSVQRSDSAPATTSMISWVISAWRARFISSVRSSISSLALSEALRMAVMRAPCSDAVDSSSAR